MKQVWILLVIFGCLWCFRTAAQTALPITPADGKDLVDQATVWINGGKPEQTNIGSDTFADSFSGRFLRVLGKTPESKEFSAVYGFDVKQAGRIAFYAALVRQGTPFASPVEFRFDREEWASVKPSALPRPPWGVSRALHWEYLGEKDLSEGRHTVEFRFNRKAPNGTWSFMCDGVVGLSCTGLDRVKIDDIRLTGPVQPGKNLDVSFNAAGGIGLAEAVLRLGGQAIVGKTFLLRQGRQQLSLPLPLYLGAADYELTITPAGRTEPRLGYLTVSVAGPKTAVVPAVISQVVMNGAGGRVELAAPVQSATRLLGMIFVGNELHGVVGIPVPAGHREARFELTSELRTMLAGREGRLVCYSCPGRPGNAPSVKLNFPGKPVKLPKPMNYGIFTDRYGHSHPWYIDRQYQYVFDGQPYIPFGGMWCPSTLISKSTDPVTIGKNLAHDRETLKKLSAAGINDVYLNMSHVAPLWVRQYFVDMLEAKGINFGYQLNAGGGGPIPAFFITRDRSDAGKNWKGLIYGNYAGGQVTVPLPKDYKVIGMLLVPAVAVPDKCFMLSFQDTEGKDSRNGIIDLETAADLSKTRKVAIKVDLPLADGSKVAVIPLLEAKMHHADLWNPERRRMLEEKLTWIKALRWGPHLRCFIDPLCNETDMVNTTENLRQYTPWINGDFARWLQQKYKTVEALDRAWQVKVDSFAVASRLLPLRWGDELYLADPEGGKIYPAPLKRSQAWLDYNDMIRETYAGYIDRLAIYLKSMVNVPIVQKTVGVHGSRTHISRTYLGWDGTGFEVYRNQGLPPEGGGGAARAEAEASSHTMWKVGTEIGHSAMVGNGGVRFFRDEAEIRDTADQLARMGVRGFYFFGIDLKPGRMWDNHNYQDFPDGLQWVARIKSDYLGGKMPPVSPSSFIYPGGFGWWWWTTRWQAVYDHEQNTIAQSVRINGNEWGSNTDLLPEEFCRVIVNCPYPPFSLKNAENINRLIRDGRRVIYLGRRDDQGTISELDRYFTGKSVDFADGSTAQTLRRLPGVTVLAEEKGQPWAIRSGNLTVISRTPVREKKNNADSGFKYLPVRWLD